MNKCPTCGQNTMIYRHNIRKSLLKALTNLFYRFRREGATLKELGQYGGDFAKLRFWGIVEPVGKAEWRITEKGIAFIFGAISLPKYVWIYDNKEVLQPPDDHSVNSQVYAKNILKEEWEPMSKEVALENSTPFNSRQIPLVFL